MVTVSGNTGSAPSIGSRVIWIRVSDESIWSEQVSVAKSDGNRALSEADRSEKAL